MSGINKERMQRLKPYLSDIRSRLDPKVPDKEAAMQLMQDLKDEGNDNFRNLNFETAHEFYYHSIYAIKLLERIFYSGIDVTFLGTIYCNAALCSLRMNKYGQASIDADAALKCQSDSVKAIYRKALALKGLGNYQQALLFARRGQLKDTKIFGELINEIKELIAQTTGNSSMKVKDNDIDQTLDWLEGTNALVNDKKPDNKKGKKMPGKKKKSKGQNNGTSKQKPEQKKPASAKEVDSDDDSDSVKSDPGELEFANSMKNIQTPSKSSVFEKGANQKEASQTNKTASQRDIKRSTTQDSGLDEFIPVGKSKSSSSQQPKKKVNIAWPLDKYVFRLVCRLCFYKESEGIKGYKYRSEYQHGCARNVLIVRDRGNTDVDWLKIRPMPERCNMHNIKLCTNFRLGNPCTLSELNCTFAHNHVEINLWALNRDGVFNIAAFIQAASKEGIYSSEMFEKCAVNGQKGAANQPYIPGLPTHSAPTSSSSTYVHPPPQLQQRKIPRNGTASIKPSSSVPYIPPTVSEPILSGKRGSSSSPHSEKSSYNTAPNIKIENDSIDKDLAKFQFKLCCDHCLIFTGRPWEYKLQNFSHMCTQHMLAFHMGQSSWLLVRERISHRFFSGNYNLCHSFTSKDLTKCRAHQHCSFAHNPLEQYLWQKEKEVVFSIRDFIVRHKQQPARNTMSVDSVRELIAMYGGYFRYICRQCSFTSEKNTSKGEGGACSGDARHNWSINRILAHVVTTTYTIIDHPKSLPPGILYRLCKDLRYCEKRHLNSCSFAHSKVEESVWRLERDTSITRDEIIKQSIELLKANYPQSPPPPMPVSIASTDSTSPHSGTAFTSSQPEEPQPPVKLSQFCGMCWTNGQRCTEDGKGKCVKGHSNFSINSVCITNSTGKRVRVIPKELSLSMKLVMCVYGTKCTRTVCTHPHNQEEMDTWNYMLRHNMKSLDEIIVKMREIEMNNTRKISEGESVVNIRSSSSSAWQTQAKPLNEIIAPGDMVINEHYCHYCSYSFKDQREWDDHCASEKHKSNVNWDKEHQWNFRQPPWGQGNSLSLCPSHLYNKSCRYSYVTVDMYNLCKYAHSQEELEEWMERLEFRKMKRNMARQKHMFSFTETLLEEFNSSNNSVHVLRENLPGVKVKCEQDYVIYKEDKNATFSWSFHVTSERNLEKVGLLRHQDRLHFFLISENGSRHQVSPGDIFLSVEENTGKHFYRIQVNFTAGLFGSFSQWVVLDFGSRPALVIKLSVEVGHRIKQVKELREDLSYVHWTGQNQKIVRCTNTVNDKFEHELLQKYKEPHELEAVVTSDNFKELNQHNYTHKMHKLLELEEITRQRLIARYNLESHIDVVDKIAENGPLIIARQGDVFLKAILPEALTEDTQAGGLVLRSVRTVLIARAGRKPDTVYEAQVVRDSNYTYDSRSRDQLYLVVCPSSAAALSLTPGTSAHLEIQFVMDRMFFCRMHYALDSMKDNVLRDVCFPDVNRFKSVHGHDVSVSSSVLNESQMAAVTHIVKDRKSYTPPFVMYGPFGTGKTETLAQATMALLKDRKRHRVLICTQSNSAADLYITKHFDKFLKSKGGKDRILRIYDKGRRINTVSPVVLPYCYKATNISFGLPSKEYIMQHEVILITVESSLQLSILQLENEFTHIFIDEAGQSLECEILMPLILASPNTCIVMTGDHVQISPTVYSLEAQKQHFDESMLVRLFNFYEQMSNAVARQPADHSMKSPFNIFLNINYRTKLEILRFISTVFYGGPENLKAYGKIPPVVTITPLTFHMVQGKEILREDETSYMNQLEGEEAVSQVRQLLSEWPEEWGERNAESVAIITFYSDQVKYIRQLLKFDKSPFKNELRNVYVGTIGGVQGKEFRALFISTVRTRNIMTEKHIIKALESGGDVGDFGFLSNPKLINTALTRAQSLVVVVGDAVALCMIGECIQEWRTYIKHCHNMKSLHPQGYSYDFIKNQVIEFQIGTQGRVIELLSRRSQDVLRQSFPPLQNTSSSSSAVDHSREITFNSVADSMERSARDVTASASSNEEINQLFNSSSGILHSYSGMEEETQRRYTPGSSSGSENSQQQQQQPVVDIPSSVSAQNLSGRNDAFESDILMLNHDISCEDIIFELAKESQRSLMPIKSDRISLSEENNFVLLHYDSNEKPNSEPFKIVSENEDFVAFSVHDHNLDKTVEYENWGIEKASMHLGETGYLRCRLVEDQGEVIATVMASNLREIPLHSNLIGKDITLPHWFDRGHAFTGDEVLVKLYPNSDESRLLGQVKGILRRAHDPVNKLFVCQGDMDQPGIVAPIQKNMPSIYTLTIAPRMAAAQKGNICVYKYTAHKCVEFSHYEKFHGNASSQRLFVVRYLTWPAGLSLPVGLVVGMVEPGTSLQAGMRILELECNLLPSIRSQANEEARQIFERDFSTDTEMAARKNLTSLFCFSIAEQEDAEDVAMAISIVESNGNYDVAIHISDVAKFISKDSTLDRECEMRGASFCPTGFKPKHMLPEQACLDFCSLKADMPRLTLTVVVRMDQLGNQLGQPQVFHSIVQVKQRFSLLDVQEILQDPEEAASDYIKSCVLVLYQISQMWRIQRLGNSHFSFDVPPSQRTTQHAAVMVNELEHYFNSQVATLLLKTFSTAVPLLVQPPPFADKLSQWRRENAWFSLNSIPMSRHYLDAQVCHCTRACMCIVNFIRQHHLQASKQTVSVQKESWIALCHAISEDFDLENVRALISSIDSLPESYLSTLKLSAIQQRPHFSGSDRLTAQEMEHYSLCVPGYTPLISPLRRFISIVVQRLLSAYATKASNPYTVEEIREICSQASCKEDQLGRLMSDVFGLNLGLALQKASLVTKAVVENANENNLTLSLSCMRTISDDKLTVPLSSLDSVRKEIMAGSGQQGMRVFFEERIYDHAGQIALAANRGVGGVELEANRFVCSVPSKDWHLLVLAAKESAQDDTGEKEANLIKCIQNVTQLIGGEQTLTQSHFPEVLSDVNQMQHRVPFSMQLQPSQCLQVQMTSCLQDGLLKPSLQLLSLTQHYDICLEHRQNPDRCFSFMQQNGRHAHNSQFTDIAHYQSSCLSALASETPHYAVASGERMTIHGVSISWSSERKSSQNITKTQGEFTLSKEFCDRSSFQSKTGEECDNSCLALLCVRYSNVPVNGSEYADKDVAALFSTQKVYTWVGHCIVTCIHYTNRAVNVKIQLSQSSVDIPGPLLGSNGKTTLCTIEWIERIKEHQVLDETVRGLHEASDFTKDVILGRKPTNSVDPLEMPHDIPGISSLTEPQRSLLEESYREAVSVIYGGPGTGKTLLVTLLSILFALRNKKADACRRIKQECTTQVMVCAPTERSLHIVTGYLRTLNKHNLQLVRVYSEDAEEKDFPLPGSVTTKLEPGDDNNVMKDIALHHLIRQKENSESRTIQEYEFQAIYGIQPGLMESMKKVVEKAQALELRKADIILCTCTTSSRLILKKAANIKQVILDDSSLISELECLMPAVHHRNVNQLVVVGDHSMPSPPVHNQTVFKMGLSKSLLHRYYDATKTTLMEQFRSTDLLTRFPSNYFYSKVLKSGVTNRQFPHPSIPWPCEKGFKSLFCHVEDTGNDLRQISNQSEASFVMSLANALIQYHKVPATSILVVTFSKVMCNLLRARFPPGITVNTVMESLGIEAEYVIVSTVRNEPHNLLQNSSADWRKQAVDPHLVNLAITRARHAMFIIGNKDLLNLYEPWKSLLQFYSQKRAVQSNSQDFLISLMV